MCACVVSPVLFLDLSSRLCKEPAVLFSSVSCDVLVLLESVDIPERPATCAKVKQKLHECTTFLDLVSTFKVFGGNFLPGHTPWFVFAIPRCKLHSGY